MCDEDLEKVEMNKECSKVNLHQLLPETDQEKQSRLMGVWLPNSKVSLQYTLSTLVGHSTVHAVYFSRSLYSTCCLL